MRLAFFIEELIQVEHSSPPACVLLLYIENEISDS